MDDIRLRLLRHTLGRIRALVQCAVPRHFSPSTNQIDDRGKVPHRLQLLLDLWCHHVGVASLPNARFFQL